VIDIGATALRKEYLVSENIYVPFRSMMFNALSIYDDFTVLIQCVLVAATLDSICTHL